MFGCCIGTVHPPCRGFCVLWLFLTYFACPITAVCTFCFGDGQGCKGDSSTCPWNVGAAANVAAVGAGGAALITLEQLLPPRYLRLFTRTVLQTLGVISSKPKGGASFSFDGKTVTAVYDAVVGGLATKDEAVRHINEQLTHEESKSSPSATRVKQLERGLTMVQKANVKVSTGDITDGVFLFVLAKLSGNTCGDAGSFDLCVEISEGEESSNAGFSGSRRFSASMKRPRTPEQMYALLHQFQMVAIATGLTNLMSIGPFLEDVVYEPVRLRVLDWPVAFELMIVYLRMVENDPTQWRLSNVVASSGGMDAKRAEAASIAHGLYPPSLFRRPRGEPRDVSDNNGAKDGKFYKGEVKGDQSSCNKGCTAWNLGNKHLAKHVDANTGICRFRHACDQYVTDKGSGGQCLGNHKRGDCTYDTTKKCSQPFK